MSDAIAKLRWIKKDNKIICEVLINGEWVTAPESQLRESRLFNEPSPSQHSSVQISNIRFKGITDNAHRER